MGCKTRLMTVIVLALLGATERGVRGDDLDPKATGIVKQAGDLLKDAKSAQVEAKFASTVEAAERKDAQTVHARIAFERPNFFSLRTTKSKDDQPHLVVVANGKSLFTYVPQDKQYTEQPAGNDLQAAGRQLLRLQAPNTGILFQNVLAESPADALMDGVTACSYAGQEKVDGVAAHHLKFVQEPFDWEMWVAAEGKPVVLKIVTDYSKQAQGGKVVVTETYSHWKFDAAPAKALFQFTPPKDAKKKSEAPGARNIDISLP